MNKFINKLDIVIDEIRKVLGKIDENQVETLVKVILKSKKIVTVGAGRMGMGARAFSMRLSHMNFDAYTLGDSNLPRIGKNDLLLVASGSGETQTIFDLAKIAKENGTKVALITTNTKSRMGKLSDIIVKFNSPSKLGNTAGFVSVQPMTTLNEQSLWLFFDILTLLLMDKTISTGEKMWINHSILE